MKIKIKEIINFLKEKKIEFIKIKIYDSGPHAEYKYFYYDSKKNNFFFEFDTTNTGYNYCQKLGRYGMYCDTCSYYDQNICHCQNKIEERDLFSILDNNLEKIYSDLVDISHNLKIYRSGLFGEKIEGFYLYLETNF